MQPLQDLHANVRVLFLLRFFLTISFAILYACFCTTSFGSERSRPCWPTCRSTGSARPSSRRSSAGARRPSAPAPAGILHPFFGRRPTGAGRTLFITAFIEYFDPQPRSYQYLSSPLPLAFKNP